MSQVKSKNTTTELAVRRLVFGMGYRYRLHDKLLPGTPDLVFPGRLAAIYVNGCFWHGHAGCRYGKPPKSRLEFWSGKIERNQLRDRENIEMMEAGGWRTLTVWQCELKSIEELSRKIYEFLSEK